VANLQRVHSTKWDGFEPEYALLGGVLKQAVKDTLQTANESLQVEALEFLQICAPTVADKLRKRADNGKPV
jgi:hypothetical protein